MAKRYRITEAQYKEVLNHLNINESEMVESDYPGYNPEPQDTPNYTLTNVELVNDGGEAGLAFYWEEEGTRRVFKGFISEYDIQEKGSDMQEILTVFKSTGVVPQDVEFAAWDNADYLHDGTNDTDFTGEI